MAAAVGTGSGFFVTGDGHIVTSYHVVAGSTAIRVRPQNGRELPAVIQRVDRANDLALLKVQASTIPLAVSASSGVRRGDTVYALGFPLVTIQGFEPKVTNGIISSLTGLLDDPTTFQITNPLQPGNSGGPIVSSDGQVVGIAASVLGGKRVVDRTGVLPQNVNYAIKSNYLIEFLRSISGLDFAVSGRPAGNARSAADMIAEAERSLALIIVERPSASSAKPGGAAQGGVDDFLSMATAVAAYRRGDYEAAASTFRQLAESGNARAQYILGALHRNGRGVTRSDAEAAKWYERSAQQGFAAAQASLGALYMEGRGVPKDEAQATKWLRLAAEQGYAAGQAYLGIAYRAGRGVAQDDGAAVTWLRLAAEQGNAAGQANLASMYRHGRGVAKDEAAAHFWYSVAAERFPPGRFRDAAEKERDALEASMTAEQVAASRDRALGWQPAK
ncbi:MAG TPA: bifunctional trypsin-like peptidase domain-containing/SEL1-like repeat protein [Burkholderiales bacterium]|nr:bifunctional trypsin-like peptidase domain-containing/SEL1-like repeat protein [Burkholderiales bacterium]